MGIAIGAIALGRHDAGDGLLEAARVELAFIEIALAEGEDSDA